MKTIEARVAKGNARSSLIGGGVSSWLDFGPLLFFMAMLFLLLGFGDFYSSTPMSRAVGALALPTVYCVIASPVLFCFWTWVRLYPTLKRISRREWREQICLAGIPAKDYLQDRIPWRIRRCVVAGLVVAPVGYGLWGVVSSVRLGMGDREMITFLYYPPFMCAMPGIARIGTFEILIRLCRRRPGEGVFGGVAPWGAALTLGPLGVYLALAYAPQIPFVGEWAMWIVYVGYCGFAIWTGIYGEAMWKRAVEAFYAFD